MGNVMAKANRVPVPVRLPKKLVDSLDEYIKKHYPAVKDRTHAIEIALVKLLKENNKEK
jgi:metal-responsive CopG/Arc/MetJ family transcriptional regulator